MPSRFGQQLPASHPDDSGDAAAPEIVAAPPYVRLTQRRPPRRDRRRAWMLLLAVLLGHVLLGWLAYAILRPTPYRGNAFDVVQVTFFQPPAELPAPPPLVPPPPLQGQSQPAAPPRVRYVAPRPGAISATLEGEQGQALHLYDSNGQIRLPPGTKGQAVPAPAYSSHALQSSQIYNGKSPVPYTPTRFNKDWAPVNQSLGARTVGRAFDKAVEKTTVKKTVKLPGGIRVHCAVSPLVLFFGCAGSPPPPPPPDRLENDVRLSMPPAASLTGKKVLAPASASSAPPASAASVPPPASKPTSP